MNKHLLLLFFIFLPLSALSMPPNSQPVLLYSQIGYDLGYPLHALIRSDITDPVNPPWTFKIVDSKSGKMSLSGKVKKWGSRWKITWWLIDFSALKKAGTYRMVILDKNKEILKSDDFEIARNLLWNKTWKTVALSQLDERIKLREKNSGDFAKGGGWQDCGSPLREVNSHMTMILGLSDLLEFSAHRLSFEESKRIREQIIIGTDYLAFCQDQAKELGRGDGAIIHEFPKHLNVITGDVAKAALAFAKAARLLKSSHQEKSGEYLKRSERSFHWLSKNGPIHHPGGTNYKGEVRPDDGFDRRGHGAPEGFIRPPEWKTDDLVMMIGVAVELFKSGLATYQKDATDYTRHLLARQIPKEKPEGEFYGHFRTFDSAAFTEKAWTHNHMGFDAGATFPHFIIPLIEMVRLWPKHTSAVFWKKALNEFATGYFLPACSKNPFYLLPSGYFTGEGLLEFSGLWHGMNGAYGSAAALALEFEKFFKDSAFRQISTGNLQWIAGLNAGAPSDKNTENNPLKRTGQLFPVSMIFGFGSRTLGTWTRIPGAICSGFDADKQFRIEEPGSATDGPNDFSDEDWITHSGGWLSALSRLHS